VGVAAAAAAGAPGRAVQPPGRQGADVKAEPPAGPSHPPMDEPVRRPAGPLLSILPPPLDGRKYTYAPASLCRFGLVMLVTSCVCMLLFGVGTHEVCCCKHQGATVGLHTNARDDMLQRQHHTPQPMASCNYMPNQRQRYLESWAATL
jgi:hypothetical protein